VSNGDCYLQFPWYFPVSEVLRDAAYVPTECPEGVAAGHRLQLGLSSVPVPSAGAAAGVSAIDGVDPSDMRLVRIVMRGPSHMHLVIRDNAQGKRLLRWAIPNGRPAQETLVPEPVAHGTTVVAKVVLSATADKLVRADAVALESAMDNAAKGEGELRTTLLSLVPLPAVRSEGVHFLSVGFGMCDAASGCMQEAYLLVRGAEPVEVAAYGHYTDQRGGDTAALQSLMGELPAWAKGAEWTKFPSMLVQGAV
jgi:hypothetical protein